ncbi:MAG: glycosyltransferase family 9 protein [Candidatus Binataceae bacterium]
MVQTGFVGDVVLATALFAPLRSAGHEVYAMVRPSALPLIRHHPLLAGALTDDKRSSRKGVRGLLETALELRRQHFGLAISPHRSHRTAMMLRLAGIPRRVGFESSPLSFLFTDTVAVAGGDHQIERNLRLLRAVGIDAGPNVISLTMSPAARENARAMLEPAARPLIGVAPGSVWATKRWPPEKFAAAMRLIAQGQHRPGFVLLGDRDECDLAATIAAGYGGPVLDLSGETSLELLCAIIERLDLLICNDSAPIHIAGAYGVPTVAVFLATHPRFGFGPFAQRYRIAQADLACRPCSPHGTPRCPLGHFNCAHLLAPEIVAGHVRELLAEKTS